MYLESIPAEPFRLAYLTRTSEPGESIGDFKARVINPCCVEFGLNQPGDSPLFGATTFGHGSLVKASHPCQQAFHGDDATEDRDTVLTDGRPECRLGYAIDASLGERTRVSLRRFASVKV